MIDSICREMDLKKDRVNSEIGSIYFGGGTPSILSQKQLQKIFNKLFQNFSVSSDAEITLEANPDDLVQDKLKELKQLPVNRFSIGVQSFFDEDLIWMNRAHRAMEAENAVKRSQDAGFENLTLDLIYGYPLLTDKKWINNIHKSISLGVPHISAYSLTVEPRTPLASFIKKGTQVPILDSQSAEQFVLLMKELQTAGFEHYEISNFSLPDRYAVHNTNYWKGVPYIGIGPSAHGFDTQKRYINPANNALYINSLTKGQLPEIIEKLSIADQFNEYVMTSLRTMWGMDLLNIKNNFGDYFLKETENNLKTLGNRNWLRIDDKKITLTQEGKLFADHIASELFVLPANEN